MITKITDHDAQALARLIEQYKESPKLKGVLTAVNVHTQELEDLLHGMYLNRSYPDAEGQQLDNIGEIVGVERIPAESDADYRIRIAQQIAKNTGFGTPENVIDLIAFLTESDSVHLVELFPAAVMATVSGEVLDEVASGIVAAVQGVLPAGVKLAYIVSAPDGEDQFGFEDSDGKGFGDYYDHDVGGKFAYVIGGDNALVFEDPTMPSKHVNVTFTAETFKDINVFAYGLDAQQCGVQVLEPTSTPDVYKTVDIDVSRPDANTIRLTSAVAISKTFRVLILQAQD